MIFSPLKVIFASVALIAITAGTCLGENIAWFNNPGATNLDAIASPMDDGFDFSLGVFSAGFTPTAGNISEWEGNWHSAQTSEYNPTTKRFASLYKVISNAAPFGVGAPGWIFGKRETNGVREWILFRRDNWNWPAPNPANPFSLDWNVESANVVVYGNTNTNGSPFLMQAALVPITYDQWKLTALAGEPKDAPLDDPDGDGVVNLIEFALNANPLASPDAAVMTYALVGGHLQGFFPRRADHQVTLVVEVSSDLVTWQSGSEHIEVLEQGLFHLRVRDLTPMDPVSAPRRFMRLKAELP